MAVKLLPDMEGKMKLYTCRDGIESWKKGDYLSRKRQGRNREHKPSGTPGGLMPNTRVLLVLGAGGVAIIGAVALVQVTLQLITTLCAGRASIGIKKRRASLQRMLRQEQQRQQALMARFQGIQLALKASDVHAAYLSTTIANGAYPSPRPVHPDAEIDQYEAVLPESLYMLEADDAITISNELMCIAKRIVSRATEALEAEAVLWLQVEENEMCVCMPSRFAGIRIPKYT